MPTDVVFQEPERSRTASGFFLNDGTRLELREFTFEDHSFECEFFYAVYLRKLEAYGVEPAVCHNLAQMQVDAQRFTYRQTFPDAQYLLILANAVPIGRYVFAEREDATYFIDIMIVPEYQNRGIGTLVIQPQMKSALEKGKKIFLHVEKPNVRARALYERLGFIPIDSDYPTHDRMMLEPRTEKKDLS